MPKHEQKQLNLKVQNDFDLPDITPPIKTEEIQEHLEQKISKSKSKDKFIRVNPERIVIVKVGFELPEEDDLEIELIAVTQRKAKKDLLAEIVKDWLRRNKIKKVY